MSSFGYAPRKQRSATTMDIIQEGLKTVNHKFVYYSGIYSLCNIYVFMLQHLLRQSIADVVSNYDFLSVDFQRIPVLDKDVGACLAVGMW